jgi:hypothetical protein
MRIEGHKNQTITRENENGLAPQTTAVCFLRERDDHGLDDTVSTTTSLTNAVPVFARGIPFGNPLRLL